MRTRVAGPSRPDGLWARISAAARSTNGSFTTPSYEKIRIAPAGLGFMLVRMSDVATPSVGWTCPACGQVNLAGVTCDACGVARRITDDPPLDLPYRPRLTRLPAFWLGLMWSAVTLLGLILWLSPLARNAIGNFFLLAQIVGAGGAAVSSIFTALWQRIFNEVELVVPQQVRTGEMLEAEVRLVPYETVGNVFVKVALSDRYYQRTREGFEMERRELEHDVLLSNARLRGRRLTSVTAKFIAPFPDTPHESLQANILADVLGLLSFAVPALAWQAKNLREHGGYFIEARVRVGLLSRRYHKRVFAYYVGDALHFG